jgi:hypothetical protein
MKDEKMIYQIVEGPMWSREMEGYPDESDFYVLVCLVEQADGSLYEEEVVFPTFNLAYDVVKHFKSQVVPYSVS